MHGADRLPFQGGLCLLRERGVSDESLAGSENSPK